MTRLSAAPIAICVLLVVTALFGAALEPFAPDAADFGAVLVPPFGLEGGLAQHLLGTDQLGRDMLSRLIAGTRISLMTAGAAVVVAGNIGVALGLIGGYLGGLVAAA